MAEREDFNTGLSEQEITQAFHRALNDYTDEEIDSKIEPQKTVIIQLLDEEPKNQARFNSLSPITTNGVNIVPDENDGTIAVSGVATASVIYNLATRMIPSGTWVLTGCPAGGSNNTYRMSLSNTASNVVCDTGDGVEFVSNPSLWSVLRIDIGSQFSSQTPIVFKPMICRKDAYELSSKFIKNELNNSELQAEINDVIQDLSARIAEDDVLHNKQNAALVELIDGGSKNLITVNSGTTSSSGGYLVNNLPLVLPAGDYHISMTRETEGQLTFVIKDANNAELSRWSRASGITSVSEDITLESESAFISIYVGNNITVNNLMVCTKAAWDISNAFVPYRPSYQELYDMVLALQGNTRSLSFSRTSSSSLMQKNDGDDIVDEIEGDTNDCAVLVDESTESEEDLVDIVDNDFEIEHSENEEGE